MDLIEFLNKKSLRVPTSYDGDFMAHVQQLLHTNYLDELISNAPRINPHTLYTPIRDVVKTQVALISGLIEVIKVYLNGQPFNAYEKFSSIIKTAKGLNYLTTYPGKHDFYRMRVSTNKVLDRKDLFHVPFDRRELVGPQRFSIAGFPSLYLAKSLYTCWLELHRPAFDELFVIRLQEARGLKYLDLRWGPNSSVPSDVYNYINLMRWPLIALSSIRVKNPKMPFKPEYIIPQILLQWIRNNKTFDGIIYNSTHIEAQEPIRHGWFTNLVIPVKESKNSGYCEGLSKSFTMTNPERAREILDKPNFTAASLRRIADYDSLLVNIDGDRPYSQSTLGQIEKYTWSRPLFKVID